MVTGQSAAAVFEGILRGGWLKDVLVGVCYMMCKTDIIIIKSQ